MAVGSGRGSETAVRWAMGKALAGMWVLVRSLQEV